MSEGRNDGLSPVVLPPGPIVGKLKSFSSRLWGLNGLERSPEGDLVGTLGVAEIIAQFRDGDPTGLGAKSVEGIGESDEGEAGGSGGVVGGGKVELGDSAAIREGVDFVGTDLPNPAANIRIAAIYERI